MKKKVPTFKTDTEAERFVDTATDMEKQGRIVSIRQERALNANT